MDAQYLTYIPVLKAKKGELDALKQLDDKDRLVMLPLLECVTLTVSPHKAAAEELKIAVARLAKGLLDAKCGAHPVALDTQSLLPTTPRQLKLLVTVCNRLSQLGVRVFPCITPMMLAQNASDVPLLAEFSSVVLRISVGSHLPSQISQLIEECWKSVGKRNMAIHVVLDMHDIAGNSAPALVNTCTPYAMAACGHARVASVTLAGGSFPYFLTGIPQGQTDIDRVEWLVWQELLKSPALSTLKFGDYAVTNPKPLADIDPRTMNPSAAIRYALTESWRLFKAGAAKRYGFAQYNDLCRLLVSDACFSGKKFSFGDDRYDHHAHPGSNSGNLMTWRRDATNHHLVFTARTLSTPYVP